MKKALYRALPFLLIFLCLTLCLSWYFYPKNNSPEAGILDYTAHGFLAEPENSLDVVILGDSIPLCAFSPQVITENTGISSYVCATTGQTLPKSESFLREFLACQSPRLVILEAHHLYSTFSCLDLAGERLNQAVPLLRYHDSWKFLRPAQALSKVQYDVVIPEKGYYEKDGIEPGENTEYMVSSQIVIPIPREGCRVAAELAALCREKGTELLILSAPSSANWNTGSHNAVENLARELGVGYVDMNLADVGIDWTLDTPDAGDHLNGSGAQKASKWLGEYLLRTNL